MKNVFLLVLTLMLFPLAAHAQLYNDKHDQMVSGIDRAAADADAAYANVEAAGSKEEALSQSEHYDYLTQPVNEANERHFAEADQTATITETENKQK